MRHLTLGLALAPTVAMAAPRASGTPGGEIVVVEASEPAIRRQAVYPSDWRADAPAGGRCEVFVLVDTKGRPIDVVPIVCPTPFVDSATAGTMSARWQPLLRDGAPTGFSFVMVLQFQPPDPPAGSESLAAARP